MAGKNVILELSKVSAKYGKTSILEDINLKISKGEFIAIIGKSGSGKTTLLNAIAGFVKAKGRIIKLGKIGVIFQNYAVFPWFTVKQNISFGLKNKNDAWHYIKMAGLGEKSYKYPFELSGGQVQRVALARTFASNPDLVLMDEPYGALDAYTREQMQKWLLDILEKEEKTVILVTHSIDEALFMADRILVIRNKKIHKEFKGLKKPREENIKFSNKFLDLKKKIIACLN